MRRYDALFVLTVMFLPAWTLGTSLAADNKCSSKPKLQSPQREHWYYYTDQVTHRKCWYTGRPGMKVAGAPASQSRASSKLTSEPRITRSVHATRPNNAESHQREAPLNEKTRDALFAEFLQWQQRQKVEALFGESLHRQVENVPSEP
jgi:hypothetical protein